MVGKYIDHAQSIAKQEAAIIEARKRLEAKGIFYPICSSSASTDENYEKLLRYGAQEAAMIVRILREPTGGDRPLEIDNVKPKKMGWDGYSD